MVRLRLDFGYDGTGFSGWAVQPGRRTVEDELTRALRTILRGGQPERLVTAGRTDSGVHARGAVAHADVSSAAWLALPGRSGPPPAEAAVTRLNAVLPADIVVRRTEIAPDGFDARFSALSRRYLYRICDSPARLDPLRRFDTVSHRRLLDVTAMHAASQPLLGLHDFAAFCKPRDGATTRRTLMAFSWRRLEDDVIEGTIVADAFCHSMVRFLVGAVVAVGEGRRDVQWPSVVLASTSRDGAVRLMPALGLSLEQVQYPRSAELASRAVEARNHR
ncbi:MAG TPA: tRNA pseudouridine(38-40) synthase TruA [Dermatophilaceae bacterium]|nr:tRNA pseudouridine(38-40) synthase TruA [Dermatophilaceae bacterium]